MVLGRPVVDDGETVPDDLGLLLGRRRPVVVRGFGLGDHPDLGLRLLREGFRVEVGNHQVAVVVEGAGGLEEGRVLEGAQDSRHRRWAADVLQELGQRGSPLLDLERLAGHTGDGAGQRFLELGIAVDPPGNVATQLLPLLLGLGQPGGRGLRARRWAGEEVEVRVLDGLHHLVVGTLAQLDHLPVQQVIDPRFLQRHEAGLVHRVQQIHTLDLVVGEEAGDIPEALADVEAEDADRPAAIRLLLHDLEADHTRQQGGRPVAQELESHVAEVLLDLLPVGHLDRKLGHASRRRRQ